MEGKQSNKVLVIGAPLKGTINKKFSTNIFIRKNNVAMELIVINILHTNEMVLILAS